MTQPTREETRNFLKTHFNDVNFTNLCFDHFPIVKNNFTIGMVKDEKIILLIEYCENHGELDKLFQVLEQKRPYQYRKKFYKTVQAKPVKMSKQEKVFSRPTFWVSLPIFVIGTLLMISFGLIFSSNLPLKLTELPTKLLNNVTGSIALPITEAPATEAPATEAPRSPRFFPFTDLYGHVWLPISAGEFTMGENHIVFLDTYWIAKYETTNAQYQVFIDDGNQDHLPNFGVSDVEGCKWGENEKHLPDFANHPVVCVTWRNALAYAVWLSEKTGNNIYLPSEQEWEKAARGPNGNVFLWGNQDSNKEINYCDLLCLEDWADTNVDDGFSFTSPVGALEDDISYYGVMDMAGNAWEWTSSLWPVDDESEIVNRDSLSKPGPTTESPVGFIRVIRGGAFKGEKMALADLRGPGDPDKFGYEGGFRLVFYPAIDEN